MTGINLLPYNTIDNRIINGDFLIDQRNEGTSITPASSGYICDQWQQTQTQASKLSFQRTGTFSGLKNSLTATTASAYAVTSTDNFTIQNRIEGIMIGDLNFGSAYYGSSIILSFNAQASITGTYCVSLQNSGATRSYVASFSLTAATPKTITLVIPADNTGTWLTTNGIGLSLVFCLGAGSTFQTTAGAWAAGNFTSVSGAVNLVGTASATFQIGNVRLYPNSIQIPYISRPYGVELNLCQRTFRKSFPIGIAPAQNTGVAGSVCIKNPIALGDPAEWIPFDPPMRATPTVTTYNPSATNANWRDITAAADVTVSVDPASTLATTGVLLATSGTVTTLGDILAIHYTADAGL